MALLKRSEVEEYRNQEGKLLKDGIQRLMESKGIVRLYPNGEIAVVYERIKDYELFWDEFDQIGRDIAREKKAQELGKMGVYETKPQTESKVG